MKPFDEPENDFPTELLAGYADGELDDDQRARVEEWLAGHPQVREELQNQRDWGPGNHEIWEKVAAPLPTEEAWGRILAGIHHGLSAPTRPATRPQRFRKFALAFIGSAFALLLFLFPWHPMQPVSTESIALLLPPDVSIDVATERDVRILSLDESAAVGLVVGDHPLVGSPLLLASFEDVDLRGIEPDREGEFPELQMTPHGANSPMIWAKLPARQPK